MSRLPTHAAPRAGFTLIELMVSTALAMAVVAFTLAAFQQLRKVINRVEAQMALNDEAQAIFMLLEKSMGSLQQSCAIVALDEKRADPAPAAPAGETGSVTLLFMSELESKDSFSTGSSQTWDRSSLVWEAWRWKRGTATIHTARSRRMHQTAWEEDARAFTIANAPDKPASPKTPFRPGGGATADYNGSTFRTGAQPRRFLDPAHPLGGPDPADPTVSRLDDNMWFPATSDASYPDPDPATGITRSQLDDNGAFKITEDVGDYSDLQRALTAPAFQNVTDLCWDIVPHDESLPVVHLDDDAHAASPAVPQIWQGVWLDGRLGVGQTAPLTAPSYVAGGNPFSASDAARRPRLIRLRFTLTHKSGVAQDYSFTFQPPGLAPVH